MNFLFLSSTFFPLLRSFAFSSLLELLAPLPSSLSFPLFLSSSSSSPLLLSSLLLLSLSSSLLSFSYSPLRYYYHYRERSHQQEYFHQGKIYQQYVKVQLLQEQ